MRGVVVRAGDPVVVAVAQRRVVGLEPVLPRLVYRLRFRIGTVQSVYIFLHNARGSWFCT